MLYRRITPPAPFHRCSAGNREVRGLGRLREGNRVAPRSAEVLYADPGLAEAIAQDAALAIAPLLIDVGRPTNANLPFDADLLAAIDEAAAARRLTRSAFLADAAREKIESGGGNGMPWSCLGLAQSCARACVRTGFQE